MVLRETLYFISIAMAYIMVSKITLVQAIEKQGIPSKLSTVFVAVLLALIALSLSYILRPTCKTCKQTNEGFFFQVSPSKKNCLNSRCGPARGSACCSGGYTGQKANYGNPYFFEYSSDMERANQPCSLTTAPTVSTVIPSELAATLGPQLYARR